LCAIARHILLQRIGARGARPDAQRQAENLLRKVAMAGNLPAI
jgi:hypothetical protein